MSPINSQKKTKTKGRKSNATKLAHKKFRFIEQVVRDTRLSPLALRAAIFVGCRCSLDHGGQAIIGQDKIAERLSTWRQNVSQALRQAVVLGHLELIRRGRDHANAYRMVLWDEAQPAQQSQPAQQPQAVQQPQTKARTTPHDVGKNPTSGGPKPPHDVVDSQTSSRSANADSKPDMISANADFNVVDLQTESSFFSPGSPSETPGKEEGEPDANASEDPPGGGVPPADAGPPRQEPAAKESERSAAGQQQESFGELRAIWQRGWPADDAPEAVAAAGQAFAQACSEDVAPEDIIEAARAHIAAADAPRFLPPLEKWLASRGWEKPPPKKRRAANGHRGNGNAKPDMFKIVLEAGGYVEDADGNMVWPGDDPNSGAGEDDEPLGTMMWGGR
jgi:hypothetical protein